jgi:flagellar biosynthesis protein FliQ
MSADFAIELIRRALMLALMLAAPMLLTALLVGIVVSLLQAVTQLQEQTLTFIPKLVALALVFILTLPWILTRLMDYLIGILQSLSAMVA